MGRHPRDGLRDRWRDEHVIPNKEIGDACKLVLLVIATRMTDRGAVSVPRDQLAVMLDVDPRRITAGIGEAVSHGLLMKTGGGYRGMTAQYVAVIPTRKVDGERPPLDGKVAGEHPPLNVHLSNTECPDSGIRKVDAEHPPNTRAYLNGRRTRTDNERDVRDERDSRQEQRLRDEEEQEDHSRSSLAMMHSATQRRSDEEAPPGSALAAVSPMSDAELDRLLGLSEEACACPNCEVETQPSRAGHPSLCAKCTLHEVQARRDRVAR